MCCKLLAVNELKKLAGERCKYQFVGGCRAYHDKRMPPSCRLWSCQWVTGKLPREMRRPDRAHYVVDPMPDFVTRVDNQTGEKIDLPVIQIWCDPAHPEAHRDPELRAWLDAERRCALVRFSASDALFIAPPSVNKAGAWYEHPRGEATMPSHSFADVIQRTGAGFAVEVKDLKELL